MASIWFKAGVDAFAKGECPWKASGGATVKGMLVNTALYTPNGNDASMTPCAAGRRSTDQTLTLIDATGGGICDASDITFSVVAAGDPVQGVILYKFVTNDAGSTPICFLEFTEPVTPNGGDIVIAWDNGDYKIMRI